MTLVGKIFTVLIFVMSLIFMWTSVMVYQTHTDWQAKAMELKDQVEKNQDLIRQQTAELDRRKLLLASEQAARRQALASLQTTKTSLEEQLRSKEQELQELQSGYTDLVAQAKTNADTLAAAGEMVDSLFEQKNEAVAQRDDMFNRLVALADDINQLEGVKNRLEERSNQLLEQLAQAEQVIQSNDLDVNTNIYGIAPELEGEVLAVNDEGKLIEISIGSDDGLREGHTLILFRNSKYVGRAEVQRVTPHRAVARLIEKYKQDDVRRGDRVATKLS